jgi:hypothetical protein
MQAPAAASRSAPGPKPEIESPEDTKQDETDGVMSTRQFRVSGLCLTVRAFVAPMSVSGPSAAGNDIARPGL